MLRLKRFAAIFFCVSALWPFLTLAQQTAWIDSATSQYIAGCRRYDRLLLEKTGDLITRQTGPERGSAKATLLLGLIYWQLEAIGNCVDDDAAVEHWGVMAIDALNEAEKANADPYLVASHKALASQLLAGLGMLKAMKYGPMSQDELKKAQKANPKGYFTLLDDAVNTSRAPVFAGGDLKKAIVMLEQMAKDFPDSVEVRIHLADAYIRVGKREEARAIIIPIVQGNPSDLFAAKVASRVKEK